MAPWPSPSSARRAGAVLSVAAMIALATPPALAQEGGFTIAEPRVQPVAGLTVEAQRSRYWAVASGGGRLTAFALDQEGQLIGTVDSRDWAQSVRAVAFRSPYLYIGDVGGVRRTVTVWRMEGPVPTTSINEAVALTLTYPDGAHSADAILVGHDRRIYVVTNGSPGGIYRAPEAPSTEVASELERVADAPDGVTDGVILFDRRVTLRSASRVYTLDPETFKVVDQARIPGEPGGSALAQTVDGEMLLAGADAQGRVVAVAVPGPAPATPAPPPTMAPRTPDPADSEDNPTILQTGTTATLIAALGVAVLAGLVALLKR